MIPDSRVDMILAAPELAIESRLVAAAAAAGVHIVRRCRDAADLLAAASAAPGAPVLVSAGLPRMVADIVDDLGSRVLVGLPGSIDDADQLGRWGIRRCVPVVDDPELDAAATWATILAVVRASPAPTSTPSAVAPSVSAPSESVSPASRPSGYAPPAHVGRLVTVWGPPGAPGRSVGAIGLAAALARIGHRTCVVDADTYAPGLDLQLAAPAHSTGLLRACRRADHLDARAILALALPISDRLHLLAGIDDIADWPDLRPAALSSVWAACREAYDITVVDVASCLEDGPDDVGPRRNAAALSAVGEADALVVVASADPAGSARLVRAWPALVATMRPGTSTIVVANRWTRRSRGWASVLASAGISSPVVHLDDTPGAMATAFDHGRVPGGTRGFRLLAKSVTDAVMAA